MKAPERFVVDCPSPSEYERRTLASAHVRKDGEWRDAFGADTDDVVFVNYDSPVCAQCREP